MLTLQFQHPGDILVANITYAIVTLTIPGATTQEAQEDAASGDMGVGGAALLLCAEALA